jgi:hypothetical protein
LGTAVGLATGVGSDEVGLGEAVTLAVDVAVGLGAGVAVDAVGLGAGVAVDAVGLGAGVAVDAVGLGTGAAVDAVGLGVGVGSSEPVATAERDGDGEAPRVTCRAVDWRWRPASPWPELTAATAALPPPASARPATAPATHTALPRDRFSLVSIHSSWEIGNSLSTGKYASRVRKVVPFPSQPCAPSGRISTSGEPALPAERRPPQS